MRKIIYFLIGVLFFGLACTEEHSDKQSQNREIELTDTQAALLRAMRSEDNKVTHEEVLGHINDVIVLLDGDTPLKSEQGRTVEAITALTSDPQKKQIALKSEGGIIEIPDTLAYVVNFTDSSGFTIIAADTRIPESVLAYVPSGTLGAEIDNPGMALFLSGLEDYIYNAIAELERIRILEGNGGVIGGIDIIDESEPPGYTVIRKVYEPWTTTSAVYPLSTVEWNQSPAPFNSLVSKNCPTGKAPAGCVAVAVAQIMAHYQYPASINGYSFDWNTLNQYTSRYSWSQGDIGKNYKTWTGYMEDGPYGAPSAVKNQVARLMERIGANVGMSYDCDGSGADSDDAISFLNRLGYQCSPKQDYNYNTVINALNTGWMIYARGKWEEYTTWIFFKEHRGGHAWLIDGYLNRSRQVQTIYERRNMATGALMSSYTVYSYEYSKLLHNNWGWGGSKNGYFIESAFFNSNLTGEDSSTKSDADGNFQYQKRINIIRP